MYYLELIKRVTLLSFVFGAVLLFTGCGAVKHSSMFTDDFIPKPEMKIEVGMVVNESGEIYGINVVELFSNSLKQELSKKALLTTEMMEDGLIIESRIVEYEKGDALKRWLLPGWGATALTVHCELKDKKTGILVGSVDARRTISIGGLYTLNAWQDIMDSVAKDVVKEIQRKIK